MVNRLNVRKADPIFVDNHSDAARAILRIGEARRGESRTAVLTSSEMRSLAYMLLMAAEDLDAAPKKK